MITPLPTQQQVPHPSWYGTRIATQDRPWRTPTGDVEMFAGATFPTSFATAKDAFARARAVSQASEGAGAIAVMEKDNRFWLSRSYNAEFVDGSLKMVRTVWNGSGFHIANPLPELRGLIDGARQTIFTRPPLRN